MKRSKGKIVQNVLCDGNCSRKRVSIQIVIINDKKGKVHMKSHRPYWYGTFYLNYTEMEKPIESLVISSRLKNIWLLESFHRCTTWCSLSLWFKLVFLSHFDSKHLSWFTSVTHHDSHSIYLIYVSLCNGFEKQYII